MLLSLASTQDELEEGKELTGLRNETTTILSDVHRSDDDDDDDNDDVSNDEEDEYEELVGL